MTDSFGSKTLALLPDGELVELAQKGQRAAFESLFHRHQDRIFTLALGIVGNAADARDVVQETFLKAYRKLNRLSKDGAVLAYLCRTASNAAIDVLRARKSSQWMAAGDDAGANQLQHPGPLPDALLERRTAKAALLEAVMGLKDDQRVVVVLHHLEGLQVDDIARRLGIPSGTVKSRLGRAREVLRRKLMGKVEGAHGS